MTRLHCVSQPEALDDCLLSASPGDLMLLLGDGCYLALAGAERYQALLQSGLSLFALDEDARTRGVDIRPPLVAIDYTGFVELSERCTAQQAWF